MSGIGRVPSSPTPVTPDDHTTTTTTTTTTTPTTPTAPTTATTATTPSATTRRPVPPSAPPTAKDIVPASILTKYGLDPNKLTTESKYEGPPWQVGYYPYSGDIQYVAFGKYKDAFNNAAGASDAHGYWEGYSNPSGGLTPGSWIGSGSIDETDFEKATGIDISGDRPIDNTAYKLMREAGAPSDAQFALRDSAGKAIPAAASDKVVPTIVKDGKLVEVEVRNSGSYFEKGTNKAVSADVTWRLKGTDGKLKGATTDKAEDRYALAGASDDVKFDFLDASGDPLPYNPPSDKIVASYKDGNAWHAFAAKRDAAGKITGYEHQTLDANGGRITARESVTPERAKTLQTGKEVIHRIQTSAGSLKGDGKVGDSYDMGWWGKCHNVAAIGASNMKVPSKDVKVVTNQLSTDKLAQTWKSGTDTAVLIGKKNTAGETTGFTLQTRKADGTISATRDVSLDEGNRLAAAQETTPMLVGRTGKLKTAEVKTFGTDEVTAMVAHMGDGAVKYEGSVGQRYYGTPDAIKLKDGRTINAFITDATTAGNKKINIGSKSGSGEYDENDRSSLRGPGLSSKTVNNGYRSLAWSSIGFDQLQASKTDKLKTLKVTYPDGHTEDIAADKISNIGWENKFDIKPTDLWEMHKKVGAKGSSVVEQDPATHVWNYTMGNINSKPLKATELSASEKDAAKRPGLMTGSTGDDGKYFFESNVNYNTYKYWAKFDPQGNLSDYGYLTDSAPDFFWTQHTKDSITEKWTGEAQAPGARMEDIQKLYNASIGAMKKYESAGGLLSLSDLARKPHQP